MKYDSLNFIPPVSVANAASLGLDYRNRAGGRGGLTPSQASKEGIGSGVQRAINLKNRSKLSPRTIRRMKAFFSRHRKNKSIDPKYRDTPWKDRGYVAWLLWGGDPGKVWAEKLVDKMDMIDGSKRSGSVIHPLANILRSVSYAYRKCQEGDNGDHRVLE